MVKTDERKAAVFWDYGQPPTFLIGLKVRWLGAAGP